LYSEENNAEKISGWMRQVQKFRNHAPQRIALDFRTCLDDSFRKNLKIMLVIDELSVDQKETLSNIIGSFRLENNIGIMFSGHVVRLHQKICITNAAEEFALSIQ